MALGRELESRVTNRDNLRTGFEQRRYKRGPMVEVDFLPLEFGWEDGLFPECPLRGTAGCDMNLKRAGQASEMAEIVA